MGLRLELRPGKQQADYTPLIASYVDSLGQKLRYRGQVNEGSRQLQLICELPDGGKAKAQLTLQEDGSLLIQNVNEDPTETPAVIYNGTATKSAVQAAENEKKP